MDKNSEIAAKLPQKEIILPKLKTRPERLPHYEEEPESSSPVRGSISRDPRME